MIFLDCNCKMLLFSDYKNKQSQFKHIESDENAGFTHFVQGMGKVYNLKMTDHHNSFQRMEATIPGPFPGSVSKRIEIKWDFLKTL